MSPIYNPKILSSAAVVALTLIIATPFCGLMFECGCTWPWSGLDAPCNFHQLGIEHQCPWCVSLATGIISLALAIICGTLAASLPPTPASMQKGTLEIAARTLSGVAVFMLLAILAAGFAAAWQDYPFGIASRVNSGNSY